MRPDLNRVPGEQRALANRIVLSAHLHELTESWESGATPLASFGTALRIRERHKGAQISAFVIPTVRDGSPIER
jgi:hypothetical protein